MRRLKINKHVGACPRGNHDNERAKIDRNIRGEIMEQTGKIEAISLKKDDKFAIKVGEDWYNGKGKMELKKGQYINVVFEQNGKWNNITRIEEAIELDKEIKNAVRSVEEVKDNTLFTMEKCISDIESIYQRLDDSTFRSELDLSSHINTLFIARTRDKK